MPRKGAEMKAVGYVNEHGREFNPNSIKSMVERPLLQRGGVRSA